MYKDPLENGIKKSSIDGWSLTHLFFYMLIGYKYPNTFILTLIFGILWELFETYIGLYEPKLFENWGFCNLKHKNLKKKWWYGKLSDPIINSIGFFIGMKINKIKN